MLMRRLKTDVLTRVSAEEQNLTAAQQWSRGGRGDDRYW
jgi:hypothetical protein